MSHGYESSIRVIANLPPYAVVVLVPQLYGVRDHLRPHLHRNEAAVQVDREVGRVIGRRREHDDAVLVQRPEL